MQVFNGKIKGEAKECYQHFSASNQINFRGVNMTAISIPNNETNPQICSVEGCSGTGKIRKTFCNKHYSRFRRKGVLTIERLSRSNTFWDYIKRGESVTDCWNWSGRTSKDGYGIITVARKVYSAHRYSFLLAFGYMPENCVLHSCDNRFCTNPLHLREGTNEENMQDMVDRNWTIKGEENSQAKLTNATVLLIKQELKEGMPTRKLAAKYEISRSVICDIKQGRKWKYVS